MNMLIRLGSVGGAVVTLQDRLTVHGHKVDSTGLADKPTMDAVARFQKARRIHEDGVAGVDTWAALLADPAPVTPRPKRSVKAVD